MSRIGFAVLASVAVMAFSAPAIADPSTPSSSAVPQKDHVDPSRTRQELAPLASAFGVKNPDDDQTDSNTTSSNETSNTTAPVEHKSLGDVADRGLTMLQDVTGKIADSLSKIAPQVWRIMIKQQIAKAIVAPLVPLGWMISAFLFSMIGLSQIKKPTGEWFRDPDPEKKEEGGQLTDVGVVALLRVIGFEALPAIIGFIALLIFIGDVKFSILHLVNPEFYAIQDLLQAVMTRTPPT